MAPKKKSAMAVDPSTSSLPVPTQTGDAVGAGGGGGGLEPPRCSGDPTRRAASFTMVTTTRVLPGLRTEPHYLWVVQRTPRMGRRLPRHPRRRMRHDLLKSCVTGSAATSVVPGAAMERPLRITPKIHRASMHANTGGSRARPQDHDRAPSNTVRSKSTSRSSHLSSPPTPAKALARAQLLLDFPPAAEKQDGWRSAIQSLIGLANDDKPQQAGPSRWWSTEPMRADGKKTGGGTTTMRSPPQQQ